MLQILCVKRTSHIWYSAADLESRNCLGVAVIWKENKEIKIYIMEQSYVCRICSVVKDTSNLSGRRFTKWKWHERISTFETGLSVHTKLPTWCTDYYLFVKYYYFPLHVSSIKYSSSGGHSCTQAAYGTVTVYKSPSVLLICSYRENSLQLHINKTPGLL